MIIISKKNAVLRVISVIAEYFARTNNLAIGINDMVVGVFILIDTELIKSLSDSNIL